MGKWLAGFALALVAVGAFVLLRGEEHEQQTSAGGGAAAQGGAASGSARRESSSAAGAAPARAGSAAGAEEAAAVEEGKTPLLPRPATEADGFVELKVLRSGRAEAGAEVKLYLHAPRRQFFLAGVAHTGKDGTARLPARPGAYEAFARAPNAAPAHQEFVRRAGEPVTRAVLELQEGLVLSGRTVAALGGDAVPFVDLELSPSGGSRLQRGMRRFLRAPAEAPVEERVHAQSGNDGRFRVTGLSPGAWSVEAHTTGVASAHAEVELPHPADLLLELTASSFIEGRVIDAQGKPGSGAQVVAVGGRSTVSGIASESGSFALEVEPRAWRLAAKRGQEAGALDRLITVAAGATVKGVDVQLGTASAIAGTVLRASTGMGVPGARVACTPRGGDAEASMALSGADGSYALEGLAPGIYDLTAAADGLSPATIRGVTVQEGQRFPLRIQLNGTGAVTGVVSDSQRAPVADAIVSVQPRRDQPGFFGGGPPDAPLEGRTGADGRYLIAGVPAGSATVTARRDGSVTGASAPAAVADGATAQADVQLQDDGVLTGHVHGSTGNALESGARVRAFPLGQRGGGGGMPDLDGVPTDAAGGYSLRLAPGSYAVQALSSSVQAPPRGMPQTTVVLAPAQTVTQDLTLADPVAGLTGKVLEPDGTPSVGARVNVRRGGGGGPMGFVISQTDEQGRFTLPAGRAELPDTFELDAQNGGRAGAVQVGPGQSDATVQLQPGGALHGHLSGGTGASFTVALTSGGGRGFGGGGGGGTQQFVGDSFKLDDLPAGTVTLRVQTDDERTGDGTATVAGGTTAEVEVALHGSTEVTGRVVDLTGKPLTQGAVSADGRREAFIGADGRFRLPGLSGGAHALRVNGGPGRSKDLSVSLTEGQLLDLGDVQLGAAQVASGTLGLQLMGSAGNFFVLFTTPGGPADAAGIAPGDVLVTIDGVKPATLPAANAALLGAPGSSVALAMTRNGAARPVQVQRAP